MINCNPFSTVFGFLAGRDPDILPSKAEKILKFLSDKQSVEIDALKIMIAAEIPIKYDVVYKIEATKHDEPIVEKAVVNTVESAFEIADEPISDVVLETSADLVMETEQLERTVEPIVETSVEVVKEASSDVVPMDESNGLDSVVAEDTGVEDQPAQEEPVVENTDVAMDTAVEEIQENAD